MISATFKGHPSRHALKSRAEQHYRHLVVWLLLDGNMYRKMTIKHWRLCEVKKPDDVDLIYPTTRARFTNGDSDGLVQEKRISSALAMELRLSCTNPSN